MKQERPPDSKWRPPGSSPVAWLWNHFSRAYCQRLSSFLRTKRQSTIPSMFHIVPIGIWALAGSVVLFAVLWIWFWLSHRGTTSFYFDAQDFLHYEGGSGRELPVSAEDGTFSEHLKHYITVSQILITVSAASIAFGGNQNPKNRELWRRKQFWHARFFTVSCSVPCCSTSMTNMHKMSAPTRAFATP